MARWATSGGRWVAVSFVLVSCSSDGNGGNEPDAACGHASSPDCGSPFPDAGALDAGAPDADPPDAGAAPDARRPDTGRSGYRIEGDLVTSVRHGGVAGFSYRAGCPGGALMTGIDGVTSGATAGSEHVHLLEPECRMLAADGALGTSFSGGVAGRDCGQTMVEYDERCPMGHVLVGLHGEVQACGGPELCAGDFVPELGLVCAPLDAWVGGDATSAEPRPIRGNYEGAVVETFDEQCEPGWVVTELVGTSDCALFSFAIGCSRVVR